MAVKVSAQELLDKGAHFGHQVRRWNPKVAKYVYGSSDGVHIFDLIKTQEALEEALSFLTASAKEGKKILLLGTKKQVKEKVQEVSDEAKISYVNERWLGGTLTNFPQIKKSLDKLSEMKSDLANGLYAKNTKKERLLIEREIARLERFFGGIATMTEIPDILIVMDIRREATAIKEATRKKVVTIGIVDSNADPDLVDYPIPMNDDATKALAYVLDLIKEAIMEGSKKK